MATAAEAARDEAQAALDAIKLEHEGFRDLRLLVKNENAIREVDTAIAEYDRRRDLLEKLKAAADALIADGHPKLDKREILDAAYKDIKDQNDSIAAALAKFSSDQARTLKVTTGAPAPKA